MAKNYIVPAKPTPGRPELPTRTMRYRGELDATKEFSELVKGVHRICNHQLAKTERSYQEACIALGIEPKPREGVMHL